MKRLALCVVLAAAAALGGCGKKEEKNGASQAPKIEMKVPLDEKHAATMGNQLPADLPAYAKVYPGADVVSVVTADVIPGSPWRGVIQYQVAAKVADVIAFYKKNAEAAGFKGANGEPIGQMQSYKAESADGEHFVSIELAAQPDGQAFVQEHYK